MVKTAFLVVLFSDTFYIMDSETADSETAIDKDYAEQASILWNNAGIAGHVVAWPFCVNYR